MTPHHKPNNQPNTEAQAIAAARTLLAQYGEDAQVIAMMRASELGFSGDLEAYAYWEMVLAAVEVLAAEDASPRTDA